MRRGRLISRGLVALLVAALLLLVIGWHSATNSRERVRALSLERARVANEIRQLRQAVGKEEQAAALLQRQLDAAAIPFPPRDEADQATTVRRRIGAWADLRYGRLFRVLGMTPQQIAAFDDLMINHQLARHDILEAAKASGVSTTDPSVAQLISDEAEQTRTRESALLGDAGYQQLQDDNRTSDPRGWVNWLASSLYSSEPLSAQQEDQLVGILANQSPAFQAGKAAETRQIQDWDTVFSQAEGVLTPAQLAAMKSMQATFPAGLSAVREALAGASK
jgi:hypothetical protein